MNTDRPNVDADIFRLLDLMGFEYTRESNGHLTLVNEGERKELQAEDFIAAMNTGAPGPGSILLALARMAFKRGLMDLNSPEEVLSAEGCRGLNSMLDYVGESEYLEVLNIPYTIDDKGYAQRVSK